jgi:RNA polymerase sigma-70 factor (ECF subfamily)
MKKQPDSDENGTPEFDAKKAEPLGSPEEQGRDASVDGSLISLLSSGTPEGITRAMEIYGPRLRRTVRLRLNPRICGRLDESDVLQETCLSAIQDLPNYLASPSVPVFVWLHRLTTRRLIDLHRRHLTAEKRSAYRESLSLDQDQPLDLSGSAWALSEALVGQLRSPSSEAAQAERQWQLLDGLQQISETDREVLLMRHFELLSNCETAAVLGISETAANNRYVRALQRLSTILRDCMELT